MMKTIVRGAVLLFLCAGACGGETDGRTSASGLVSEEPVFDLSASDLQQLCDWVSEELGGASAPDECTVETPNVACGEVPPSCVALVEDVEACAREQRALEACEVGEEGPACARLARLCPVEGTIEPGTVPLGDCVPGQTGACACPNGTLSAQTCGTDGVWSACACENVRSVCISGQTAACVCSGGLAGAQTCIDEDWGPCVCASSGICETAQTRACSCENGAPGAQFCDGREWLPCDCTAPGGTCDAAFCPSTGGRPCCVFPDGPCGQDFGMGCMTPTPCPPGETRPCPCTDGALGAQSCDANGQVWLPCDCTAPGGTCNAAFCPALPGGTPCCVTVNGPCGQDLGMGCVAPTLPGAD